MRMRYSKRCRLSAWAAAALALSSGLAPAADAVDSSFKKPRADIVASVKTIGLLPVEVAGIVPNPDAVAARYESLVIAQLEQAGFQVVKPAAMREIRERFKQNLGGLYDPVSGRAVPGKVKAFNEYARNEYLANQKVDALLWVGIIMRRARNSGLNAEWDGVSDSSTGRSGVGGFLANAFSGVSYSGMLPALSVGIVLTDTHDARLYERAGGLQVLEYVRREASGSEQRFVDPQSIMSDPARDARALAIALDPLTQGTAQLPKSKVQVAPVAPVVPASALRVPRQELLGRYRTLAIGPLAIHDAPRSDEIQQRYHELLAAKLRQLGFAVAGDNEYADLWTAEAAAAKGYYDPFTGNLDRAKLQASRQRVFALLHDKYPIDAVILPSVAGREAPFSSGKAHWDGVSEPVTTKKHGLGALLDRDSDYLGYIDAISLELRIADGDDTTLFEDSGGIQVIEQVAGGRQIAVPQAELFADAAKNAQAVEAAFRELASAPQ